MKHLTFCLTLSFLFLQNLKSQDSLKAVQIQEKPPSHNIRLYLPGGQNMEVKLMDIRDSSIYIYQKQNSKLDPLHKINIHDTSAWEKYDYKVIVKIKVMDSKLRTWTIVGGTVIGLAAGAIIIDNRKKESGLGAVEPLGEDIGILLLTGGAGAIAGLIVASSIEKKYKIDGDWKKFGEMKTSLHY